MAKSFLINGRGGFAAGEYGTTGGHLEFGESFAGGVLREIEEENGIKVKNLKWLHVSNIVKYAPEHFVDITFSADWESGEPQVREPERCESWAWYDPDTLTFSILEPVDLGLKSLKQGKSFKRDGYYRIWPKDVAPSINTNISKSISIRRHRGNLKVGVGIMVMKQDKVLIGRRKGSFASSQYTLAGGHLNYMESPEGGARREVIEETGLELGELKLCAVLNNIIEGEQYVSLSFVGQTTGEPELREPEKNEGWKWLDLDEIPEPLFIISRQTIEHYKKGTIVDDPNLITIT